MSTLHLSVINDGETYQERLEIARSADSTLRKYECFYLICQRKAAKETREFGVRFSSGDIEDCAAEVAAYMERHVKEF